LPSWAASRWQVRSSGGTPAELTARRRDHAGRLRQPGHILDYLVQLAATMGA
jgi:hypothetical protein